MVYHYLTYIYSLHFTSDKEKMVYLHCFEKKNTNSFITWKVLTVTITLKGFIIQEAQTWKVDPSCLFYTV